MASENFHAAKESAGELVHKRYMKRALELAKLGAGSVSPNPLVGCVIVHDDRIIGEGWHKKYGGPHAEVNAIASVGDKSLLPSSTLYVNLEPCSHTGKTPPCADLLIQHQVKKVVVSNLDSNPLVAGSGIKRLRDAGIEVITDVLLEEGYSLNRRFFTYMENRRPYLILKWAQTADGFIARSNEGPRWISGEYSRQRVHKWRTEEDAVLVGSGTAVHDNPRLNVRNWTGRDPVRVVIDRHLSVPRQHHVFDGTQRTICFNLAKDESQSNLQFIKLQADNFVESVINSLYALKIQSVVVEGGRQVLDLFIHSGLWDEARIFISPQTFGEGIPAPDISGHLRLQEKLDNDWLKIYGPSK